MHTPSSVLVYFVGWIVVLTICIAATESPFIAGLWAVILVCLAVLACITCAIWEKI